MTVNAYDCAGEYNNMSKPMPIIHFINRIRFSSDFILNDRKVKSMQGIGGKVLVKQYYFRRWSIVMESIKPYNDHMRENLTMNAEE